MVVLYVTLYLRVTMSRPTAASPLFSLLRTGSAVVIALAGILSCSDNTSPTQANGVTRVLVPSVIFNVPDSVKERLAAEALAADAPASIRSVPIGPVATVLVSPGVAAASVMVGSCSSGGNGGGFPGYVKSRVAFTPEALPSVAPYPLGDEGYIPANNVLLGFNFNFEGNTYDRVNVYFNGFLLFGQAPGGQTVGYSTAGSIASIALPNNIIALGWTDLDLSKTPDAIRYETRGTAPNRKFILQFYNAPEYHALGALTSQVVLSEGSNDITIYTTSLVVKNTSHLVTQGIENALGTDANYDSVTNVNTGITSRRVRNFFSLQNDAIRFSVIQTKDLIPPTITAPANVSVGNDPGLATAVVAVGSPVAADNCGNPTVSGVRSDGLALDAPYPVGLTTITWTATDATGNTASATQTVTVLDIEPPVFGGASLRAVSPIQVNATSPNGAVVTYPVNVTDNVGVTKLSCEPASGSEFPVGNTVVSCTASDAAGNTASNSFSVNVIGAHQQLGNMLDSFSSTYPTLPNGTLQPLMNQLSAAYRQPDGGVVSCTKLGDFTHMVEKKSSNISSDDAASMVADATRIMDAMGCSTP
jgi:hypothetical protein